MKVYRRMTSDYRHEPVQLLFKNPPADQDVRNACANLFGDKRNSDSYEAEQLEKRLLAQPDQEFVVIEN